LRRGDDVGGNPEFLAYFGTKHSMSQGGVCPTPKPFQFGTKGERGGISVAAEERKSGIKLPRRRQIVM
jgi:hypothetical protein